MRNLFETLSTFTVSTIENKKWAWRYQQEVVELGDDFYGH